MFQAKLSEGVETMKRLELPLFAAIGVILAVTSSYSQPDSLWSVQFGSRHNDQATAVYELDNGAFLIGCNSGTNGENWDASLLMFSPSGDSLWGKVYHAPNDDFVKTILPWFYGGYMLCGWSRSFSTGYPQFYMLAVDGNGKELWKKAFGEDECITNSVVIDENADYYFLGTIIHRQTEDGPRTWDARIMKISARGDSLWTKDYGDDLHDERTMAGIRTQDGGFAMTGSISTFDREDYQREVLVLKFDRFADLEWRLSFETNGTSEEGRRIVQTEDGGYVVGGVYVPGDSNLPDGFLLRVDADGNPGWFKNIGGDLPDYINAADLDVDGNPIFCGASQRHRRSFDYWIFKINSMNGDIIWEKFFGGLCWDYCRGLKLMNDGSLMMLGESQTFTCDPNHLINDSWVIRAGFPNNVGEQSDLSSKAGEPVIVSVVPNPFNSQTVVSLNLPSMMDSRISLFDETGREIRNWQMGAGQNGSYQISIDGIGLAAGNYWLEVRQKEQTASVKLVLVK